MAERYQQYLEHAQNYFGRDAVVIDSSKSLESLQFINDNIAELPIESKDICVALCVKDVRSFVQSEQKRKGTNLNLFEIWKTMRRWHASNEHYIDYLRSSGLSWFFVHYERLCLDEANLPFTSYQGDLNLNPISSSNNNHIILSNKDFLRSNSDRVKYDFSWFQNRNIQRCYSLSSRVAFFNENLYSIDIETESKL